MMRYGFVSTVLLGQYLAKNVELSPHDRTILALLGPEICCSVSLPKPQKGHWNSKTDQSIGISR
jgi:hypothetical protein